ncbi:MAG TPA: AraC family transcriptional regulator [Thermomicrobiales bacterium]|nr:AraC family transcriptional regulator [Thermomicrobiales bacterium]
MTSPSTPPPDSGARGVILHARARRHYWEGEGRLSIKTFAGGRALYRAGGGYYAVDEAAYLVLNEGQPYAIAIESPTPVESFCVFFAPGFAGEVARSLTLPAGRLLDEPDGGATPVSFFERTYPHDEIVSPALRRLRAAHCRGEEPGRLDELWHELMAGLLRARRGVCREVAGLAAARAATREELYRRAHRAREYAAALCDQPVTLDDLARVACLSPNHLLRVFREVFHQTPHQYLTARRLERARHLLAATDEPVTEVCLAVGFQSHGSFSRLFRRHCGLSPAAYRRQHRPRPIR